MSHGYNFKRYLRKAHRLSREEWLATEKIFNSLANSEWWAHPLPSTELYKVYEKTRRHAEGMAKLMEAWGDRI